ncbi:hypothetical protein D3C86_2081210 [compost metagenome]
MSAFDGYCGRAPTRMRTLSSVSKWLARSLATIEMKPGARPHCGMKAVLALAAIALTWRVDSTSSVRSR